MNPIKVLIFIFIFIGAQASMGSGFSYEIKCEGENLIEFKNLSEEKGSADCASFLSLGFEKCFDSRKNSVSPEKLTLSSVMDHYYKTRASNNYSRARVNDLVEFAVQGGTDPYLILAIALVENPPIMDSMWDANGNENLKSSETYAARYGMLPIDSMAAADVFQCDKVALFDENGKPMNIFGFKLRGNIQKVVAKPGGVESKICLAASNHGSPPSICPPGDGTDCCLNFVAEKPFFPMKIGKTPFKELKDSLALIYTKKRLDYAVKKAASVPTAEKRMAVIAQSYNGYGKIGATEKVKNRCLSGVDMNQTPVYGAGVSELMMNTLMNNSEIQTMVSAAQKKYNYKSSKSYLCTAYGNGVHAVSGRSFTNLLNEYLGARTDCPKSKGFNTYQTDSRSSQNRKSKNGDVAK